MTTFNEIINVGASLTNKFAVHTLSLGDGYVQTSEKGLKSTRQEWTISVTEPYPKILMAKNFINEHRKVNSFEWENPFGKTINVKAGNLKISGPDEGGLYTLSATFTQEV